MFNSVPALSALFFVMASTASAATVEPAHLPSPPTPQPIHVDHLFLGSRGPRVVGGPKEDRSRRTMRRSPEKGLFIWDGGAYAL